MNIRLIGNQIDSIRNKFRIRGSTVYLFEPQFTTRDVVAIQRKIDSYF